MKSKGDAAYGLEPDGTMMQLVRGEVLPYESLLYGLMLCSGNDAANVLAESIGGTVPAFVDKMNAHAASLGCKNTHFSNPHGLHHTEHYSTAYDMCLIARGALRHSKIRQIVSTISHPLPKTNKQPAREIKQQNKLLKEGPYHYPKAIGLKTGFHSAAKYTLVAAAEHEGRTLIAAVMGTEKSIDRYVDARTLFEAAFAEKKERKRFLALDKVFTKELEGAKNTLRATIHNELAIEYFPAEEPQCKAFVHWTALNLPIAKGQKVGEVRILSENGTVLQNGDLFACEEVKATFLNRLKKAFF
jgi:D-alanyl-D-alanine carboxypeptidase (penicillin-binding protein 5/6)